MCIQPMKKDLDIQKNVRDILTFYAMQEDTREDRHRFWQDRARQLLQGYRTMKQRQQWQSLLCRLPYWSWMHLYSVGKISLISTGFCKAPRVVPASAATWKP